MTMSVVGSISDVCIMYTLSWHLPYHARKQFLENVAIIKRLMKETLFKIFIMYEIVLSYTNSIFAQIYDIYLLNSTTMVFTPEK